LPPGIVIPMWLGGMVFVPPCCFTGDGAWLRAGRKRYGLIRAVSDPPKSKPSRSASGSSSECQPRSPGSNEFLREAVKLGHNKINLALSVIVRLGFAVKTAAETLDVSRFPLHSRLREGSRPRGRSLKSEDSEPLSAIRTLTDDRPTYGYRLIWALLNR
jgi:hypothetical protein